MCLNFGLTSSYIALSHNLPSLEDANTWADFWRYKIGRNTFPTITYPANSNWFSWKKYQDKPIPEELHNQLKSENKYSQGIAVMAGKGYSNNSTNDLYLNEIDLDNEIAIKGICTRPDCSQMSVEDLARWTLVEQHLDDGYN